MTVDCVTFKLAHLRDLAPFASDAALRYMQDCALPGAVELNRLAGAVIAGAGYRDDPDALRGAFEALAPADRAGLEALLRDTSLLQTTESPNWDAVQELDDALNYHWPKHFGFADEQDARAELGESVVDQIMRFVTTKADEFWKRDALTEASKTAVLSEKDMRIVSGFAAGSLLGDLVLPVSLFVDTELLRLQLREGALRLPPAAAERLESGLNAGLQSIRPDRPGVHVTEWLT